VRAAVFLLCSGALLAEGRDHFHRRLADGWGASIMVGVGAIEVSLVFVMNGSVELVLFVAARWQGSNR